MIPEFPNFKKLELSDKDDLEVFTSKFPPYSDFNFTSLWVWDTTEKRTVSKLNGNLVVCFTDYENGAPLLSFLGENEIEKTAKELIHFAESNNISPTLYFISEEIANTIKNLGLRVEEDLNHFDHILNVADLVELKGSKFKNKRSLADRFLKELPQAVLEFKDLSDVNVRQQIVSVLMKWKDNKKASNNLQESYFEHEEKALYRFLNTAVSNDKIIITSVCLNNHMIGFSVDEVVSSKYAISHFFKADTSYKGIYDFLNKKTAEHLRSRGIEWWNWEQDLGIEKIKKAKLSYHPSSFLKKYKVSLTSRE